MGAAFKNNWIFLFASSVVIVMAYYESIYYLAFSVFLLFFLLYKKLGSSFILFFIGFTALFTFYLWQWFEQPSIEQVNIDTELFTLSSEPTINGAVMRGFMKSEKGINVYYMYKLRSEAEKLQFEQSSAIGLQVRLTGKWVSSDIAHRYSFNMNHYLRSKQAVGTLEIEALQPISFKASIQQRLAKQRFQMKQFIEEQFPASLSAEAQALLIGLQDDVEQDMERAYQKLGITHLFAISGLHIALLSYLYYEALLRLKIRREVVFLSLIIILPIYAVLAGGAPSVWRAVSIVEIAACMQLFRMKWPLDDVLSLSGLLYVLTSPPVIFQVGFQLSYLATFSIIYSSQLLRKRNHLLLQNFYLTFVCQILTYPLLLLHFYELSLSSFLANVFFVPLFSFVILPINLLLLICAPIIPGLATLLFQAYEPFRVWLADLLLALASIPHQMWVAGKPTLLAIVFLYASVFTALYYLEKGTKLRYVLLILIIPAIFYEHQYILQRELQISFINVGQGDSILIELPRREKVYLIDTGGLLRFETEEWKARNQLYEVGRQVVVPFLKGKGISTIDALILTHADADHVEGADEIIKEMHVKEIHISPNSIHSASMQDLVEEAKKRSIKIVEKLGGQQWKIGDVQFAYLWPVDLNYEGNNDSLVLYMQSGAFKALFTGDLEVEGELDIINRYGPLLNNITLLKAGHHGSKTSSAEAFLRHLRPQLTIFMAGKDNRYKHPSKEVVERMDDLKLPYKTTGYDGTVEIVVRNGQMYITSPY